MATAIHARKLLHSNDDGVVTENSVFEMYCMEPANFVVFCLTYRKSTVLNSKIF